MAKREARPSDFYEEVRHDVARKVDQWRSNRSFGVAADLLNYSHISYVRDALSEPAQFVLDHSPSVSPQISSLAKTVLGVDTYQEYGQGLFRQKEMIRLKKLLRLNPRDAVANVDLARYYVISKKLDRASKHILTAVALAADNRFVLRSAARFYVHSGDPERALFILKKSARTAEDPWLLASMIAIETIQERVPLYFKRARSLLDQARLPPLHLAELGAALATLQLNAGHLRNARRLFNQSLSDPNDNTVAQAVWAANEFSMHLAIEPEWLSSRFSSEASYYTYEKTGDYRQALNAARNWFDDEPFSIRPLQAGSFAASILGMYDAAEDQVRQALLIDPTCCDAKNNLIFALAGQSKLDEAIELLNEVYTTEIRLEKGPSGHTFANRGMLFYRTGDMESGYKNYSVAVSLLERRKELTSRAVALAYWVREATLAQDPRLAEIRALADGVISSGDSVAAKIVLANLKCPAPTQERFAAQMYKSVTKWEHDKKKNILIMSRRDPFKV